MPKPSPGKKKTKRGPDARKGDIRATTPRFDPNLDYRKHPERYRIARGEQGVLTCQPYKSELLPLWRFASVKAATHSIEALTQAYRAYKEKGDWVGMDMARKYLQMGKTRALRYARHAGGRKYDKDKQPLPQKQDPIKHEVACLFALALRSVVDDEQYQRARLILKERQRQFEKLSAP